VSELRPAIFDPQHYPEDALQERTVLDACCGSKMFWFNKQDKRTLFLDIKKEGHFIRDSTSKNGGRFINIEPDLIGTFTNLPFDDESFYMVVFDPPHVIKKSKNSWVFLKYGELGVNWENVISDGFRECFRVLKPNGTLIFKWSVTHIQLSKILALTDNQPLFGNKCGKRQGTHWVVFIK